MPNNPNQPTPPNLKDSINLPQIPEEPAPLSPVSPVKSVIIPSEKPQETLTPIKPIISAAPPRKKISPKSILGLFALFFLLGSIPAAVFLVQQRQEIREKAAECDGVNEYYLGKTGNKQCDCNNRISVEEHKNCLPGSTGPHYYWEEGGGLDCNCTGGCSGQGTCVQPPPSTTVDWKQCTADSGTPCGSCSISLVSNTPGKVKFGCELNCGGFAKDCPGGSAGSYDIVHHWERCLKNIGTDPNNACTESSSDWVKPELGLGPGSGVLENGSGNWPPSGPWTIAGQTLVDGSATFPIPDCGRVQADVQIKDTGTDVAGVVYSTGKNCSSSSLPPSEPPPPSSGVSCNYDQVSLNVSPNSQQVGGSVTFSITGDASTYIQDSWNGGVDCQGDFASSKTCKATAAGNFTWTHQWRHCEGSFDNCSGVCSESANFTITAPPTYTCKCGQVKIYDTNWAQITNLSTIKAGQALKLTVSGQTDEPQGLTKAHIRVNSDPWQETTNKKPNTNEFYIDYPVPASGGSFTVEGEVYNPALGWK